MNPPRELRRRGRSRPSRGHGARVEVGARTRSARSAPHRRRAPPQPGSTMGLASLATARRDRRGGRVAVSQLRPAGPVRRRRVTVGRQRALRRHPEPDRRRGAGCRSTTSGRGRAAGLLYREFHSVDAAADTLAARIARRGRPDARAAARRPRLPHRLAGRSVRCVGRLDGDGGRRRPGRRRRSNSVGADGAEVGGAAARVDGHRGRRRPGHPAARRAAARRRQRGTDLWGHVAVGGVLVAGRRAGDAGRRCG